MVGGENPISMEVYAHIGFLSHGGTPSYHPFIDGIFRHKPLNHPFIDGMFHYEPLNHPFIDGFSIINH